MVLAIGASPYRPEGEYLYNQNPNVMLSLDMDAEIMGNTERLQQAQAVAFIQCVGSRIPERPYCNKVCCAHSVENAIKLKVMDPEREVYILYRDMRTYGERELLYQRAGNWGWSLSVSVWPIRPWFRKPTAASKSRSRIRSWGDRST